jgi:hypothetical protein
MMVAAGQALAQAPAASPANPAQAILERDLRLFESWFPGAWDNAEQVFFAEEQGRKEMPPRVHAQVTAEGAHVFTSRFFANNDLSKPIGERRATASVDVAAGAIRLSAPDCEIVWRRQANQFVGDAPAGSCGSATPRRFVMSAEDFWAGETRMMRARAWSCWMAVPREDRPGTWFSAFNLKILDQGGEVWVRTDEATPREIGYRLRQVKWPAGTNQDALTLYVLKRGERAPGYAWASPDATRIGINLRWVQGSCSR